jgi:hypothetical protein
MALQSELGVGGSLKLYNRNMVLDSNDFGERDVTRDCQSVTAEDCWQENDAEIVGSH